MTAQTYAALSAPFRRSPAALAVLRWGNKLLTLSCYLLYPALLLWALLVRDPRLVRLVLVPGAAFLLVSVFRKACDSPRPYQVLDIQPLIPRDKQGESFPSRHVFSVFVIAMAWGYVCPPVGWALLAVGVLLAAARVVGGVHFPKDVIAGAAIGLCAGAVGFYLIP